MYRSFKYSVMTCLVALSLPLATPLEASLWSNLKDVFVKKQKAPTPQIKVLILDDVPGAMVEVKGKYRIYDPHTNDFLSTRFLGKRKYMQPLLGGLKWGEEFPGMYQMQIVPDTLDITTAVDGLEYKGSLYIYDVGGAISIVNSIDLEEYLAETFPHQVSEEMPEELVSALAIVARTDAYYQMKNPQSKYWDVQAKKVNYKGILEKDLGLKSLSALKATRHMVLSETGVYEAKVTPIMATFSNAQKDLGVQEGAQVSVSKISLKQASELASAGFDAADILKKSFPDTHIEIIYKE